MKCSLLTLSSYVDGELDAARQAEVDAHLVGCDRCRKGVECLREESEGFGALGRLHISDDGVHAFMEQLGLVGADDVLPPRLPRPPGPARGREAPPWVATAGTAAVLPWMSRPDPAERSEPDQPSLPFRDQVSDADPETVAAPFPAAAAFPDPVLFPTTPPLPEDEVHLSGRSIAVAPAAATPAGAAPAAPMSRAAVEQGPPGAGTAVPAPAAPAAPSEPLPPAMPEPEDEDDYPWPPTDRLSRPRELPPPPPPPPSPSPPTTALEGDDDPWSWAPRDRSPPERRHPEASLPVDEGLEGPADWDARAAAGAGSERWDEDERGLSVSDTTPDPLIDPLIARVARPPRLVQPTLISRLRDEVALRLTLTRAGSGGNGGAHTTPAERGRPTAGAAEVAVSRVATATMEAPAREEAARSDGGAGIGARPSVAAPEHDVDRDPAFEPRRRGPTIAEELPGPTAFTGGPLVRDLDRGQLPPGRHARRLGQRRSALGISGSTVLRMVAGLGDLPARARRAGGRSRQRWLAAAVLVALLLVVSLVISHAGQSVGGAPAAANPRSSAASVATPSLRTQPTASLGPSTSVAPSPAPTPSPSTTPAPTATPAPSPAGPPAQTVGSGGAGWQLAGVRYGNHGSDLWIVLDLQGGSGQPTAAVAFSNPTLLTLTFTGVSVAGVAPAPDGVVTGVAVSPSGGHGVLSFHLSRSVTLKRPPFYTGPDSTNPYPLHLILDLG